jgi:DNA gyrase/topoisomerase IV subunit A
MDSDLIRAARGELEIVEGILAALERRGEVIAVVGASADRDAAERQLLELLDVTAIGARAVLDQPVSRFTSDERLRVRARREELRNLLDEQRSD